MKAPVHICIEEENGLPAYLLKRNPPEGDRHFLGPATQLRIQPMPGGDWALVGDSLDVSISAPLLIDDLRKVVLLAEDLAAEFPELPVDASTLSPRGIKGYLRLDRQAQGGWAQGVVSRPVRFRNADHLYHFLRARDFRPEPVGYVRERRDERLRLFRSHDTVDSMTAWEIAGHRLDHGGDLPAHLEVPADTCPQCLSRFLSLPMDGSGRHCQECHYASQD